METTTSSWKKNFFKIFAVLLLIIITAFGVYFYMPYSNSGVRAGQLNNVMHKGVVFKTYEGRLIQTGIRTEVTGGIQSNTFEFSIKDKAMFEKLSQLAGKHVTLHYKEYYGSLPWRGYTKYIVDSVVSVDQTAPQMQIDPNVFQAN